jgi:hypothetical protein
VEKSAMKAACIHGLNHVALPTIDLSDAWYAKVRRMTDSWVPHNC